MPLPELKQVIIATSEAYLKTASSILARAVPPRPIECECVKGGEERQQSIYNTLHKIGNVELVAVHDAVRPFVALDVIKRCMKAASETGAAVPGVKAKDTIKKVNEDLLIISTPHRKKLWQTQTPQIFRKEILLRAHQGAFEDGFLGTDDSSLVERLGIQVKMVEGDRDNFKITYPVDLKLAELLLGKERAK